VSAAISRKVYQMLLLLYPADFRHEFGDEMLSMFEECTAGQSCLLVFADAFRSAAKQHVLHFSITRSRDECPYSDIGCSPHLPRILASAVFVVGLTAGVLGHGLERRTRDSRTMAPAEVRFWFPTGVAIVERKSQAPDSWRVLRFERTYGK
jgi:hypothetical protein